jgi:hypothetical protein
MKVTFLVDAASAVPCAAVDATTCRFTLSFLAQGFPLGTQFRVAARSVDPTGAWSIGAPALPSAALPADGFAAPASVPRQAAQVQLVVLVYLQPPDFVPDQVELLGESGADLAFVASPVAVE